MWPLAACALIALGVSIWKLIDSTVKGVRTGRMLREVDALM